MNVQPVFDVIDWANRTSAMGPITWMHLFLFVVAISVAFNIYKYRQAKRGNPKYLVYARCNDCGWLGQVSKLNKVCRKCQGTSMRLLTPADAADLEKARKRK